MVSMANTDFIPALAADLKGYEGTPLAGGRPAAYGAVATAAEALYDWLLTEDGMGDHEQHVAVRKLEAIRERRKELAAAARRQAEQEVEDDEDVSGDEDEADDEDEDASDEEDEDEDAPEIEGED